MTKAKARYTGPFDEVSFYIGRVFYDHVRLLELLLEETGLNKHLAPGMGQVLFNLFEEDDVIIKNLTGKLRCSPSHLTSVLGKMEKVGVITRRRDKDDGRATRVRLTPRGRSLEKKCRTMLRELNRRLTEGLSDKDVARMKDQLDTMVQNVKRYREMAAGE